MRLRPRLVVLIALLVITAAGAAVFHYTRHVVIEPARLTASQQVLERRPHPLPPDARALVAISDIHHLITGAPRQPVTVRFDNGRWQILHGGAMVGSLAPFADYPETRAVLARWAARLRPDTAIAAPDGAPDSASQAIVASLDALHAMPALARLDRAWRSGRHDRRMLAWAARAYALAALETGDRVGASDSLLGRAWAVVTVASTLDSASARRDECLLASVLGYGSAACAMAARLPAEDPMRAFVLRQDGVLRGLAARSGREAGFLWLERLASRRDLEAWEELADTRFGDDPSLALPVLGSGLALGRFESSWDAGTAMLAAVSAELRLCEETEADGADAVAAASPRADSHAALEIGDLVNQFERLLSGLPAATDGPLLDRPVIGSYYRAAFYSGLGTIAGHLLYALSSVPDAQALSHALGDSCVGAGEEFRRWLADLADAKSGVDVTGRLDHDLAAMPHFGAGMIELGYDAFVGSSEDGTGNQQLGAARLLVDRLDGRPTGLWTYADMHRTALYDPLWADTVDAAAAGMMHPADVAWWCWWGGMTADTTVLLRLARDPDRTIEERQKALSALDGLTRVDSETVERLHRALVVAAPRDYEAVDRYAAYLSARGHDAAARGVLASWLATPDRSQRAFDEIRARVRLAKLYERDGEEVQAFQVIQPVVSSWAFSALSTAARVEDDLGHTESAMDLARAAWKRYPDSETARTLLLRLYWRHGHDTDAAQLLESGPDLMNPERWREDLVPVLRERFTGHPDQMARALDREFQSGDHLGEGLQVLAKELDRAGDAALAFEVASRVHVHTDNAWIVIIDSYRYLRASAGAEAARRWLDEHTRDLDDEALNRLLPTAFGEGEDALVWDLRWPKPRGDDLEFLWMLRAAGSRRTTPSPEQRHALAEHFATPGDGHYHLLGRYLLGLETEAAAHAEPATTRAASETDYYLGFAAEQEGRIVDAARWYARCAALNMHHNAEDYWARRALARWATSGRTVARIEAETRAGAHGRAAGGDGPDAS